MKNSGIKYMKLALELAAKAKERTYPNPMVGAVIVKKGKVIGSGYHRRAGCSHAEIEALSGVSGKCSNGTLFVTLEPCDHYGKTPPCTQAIIASGIKTVNVAMKDPNPLNAGCGIRRLKNAGIRVNVGLCAEEAAALNKKYIKFVTTKLPYVTLKLAQSLDGKIAARNGTSKWISSDISRKYARKMRSDYNGVMVGVNTVIKDDPFLLCGAKKTCGTARIIVDTRLKTALNSNIIRTADKAPVIIGTTELAPESRVAKFRRIKGVEVVVTRSRRSKVPLKNFLRVLGKMGMVNILVEGGGQLAGSLMDALLVDEAMFFIAPSIIGGGYSSVRGDGVANMGLVSELRDVEVKNYGKDIFIRGSVCSRA